jgi:hypothetical protein
VCVLNNSFTMKLGYLIFLDYLISFLIRDFPNPISKGIDISIDGKLSDANNS